MGGAVEMPSGWAYAGRSPNGTMCPSYMATKDEPRRHQGPRQRAAASKATNGLADGYRPNDHGVYETLDLCLECRAAPAADVRLELDTLPTTCVNSSAGPGIDEQGLLLHAVMLKWAVHDYRPVWCSPSPPVENSSQRGGSSTIRRMHGFIVWTLATRLPHWSLQTLDRRTSTTRAAADASVLAVQRYCPRTTTIRRSVAEGARGDGGGGSQSRACTETSAAVGR